MLIAYLRKNFLVLKFSIELKFFSTFRIFPQLILQNKSLEVLFNLKNCKRSKILVIDLIFG